MKVVVTTPYPEASIRAIASALWPHELQRLYVTLDGSAHGSVLGRAAARAAALRGRQARSWGAVPPTATCELASSAEVLRIVASRSAMPRSWTTRAMHFSKRVFDSESAKHLPQEAFDAVVGMQGSSARTFTVAKQLGRFTVLNHVNSRPSVQNRLLRECAGAGPRHHELVPDEALSAQARELTLADIVLVPSRLVARQLTEAGLSPERIRVHPYGVDVAYFQPASAPAGSRRHVRCLFVGEISLRKGVQHLAAAASSFLTDPISFDLVGPMVSPEALRSAPPNLTYHGVKSRRHVLAAMQDADIFVLPTVDDSFGLVVLEAMACGLPVIVTDRAGSSELIRDGIDGVVVPAGDVKALARAIRSLATHGAWRHAVSRAALDNVRASHSWARYAAGVRSAICAQFAQ